MTLNSGEVLCREIQFDNAGGATAQQVTNALNGTGAADYSSQGKGLGLSVTADEDYAYVHFGDNLAFDIDDLQKLEILFQISGWDDGTTAILGMGSAFNATTDSIAAQAMFKILPTRALVLETDDGTTDIDDHATGIVVPEDTWCRAQFDFATGIQTVSPPGVSKGGKGSIQALFSSTSDGRMIHLQPTVHLDMSAYTGGLQLIAGLAQAGAESTTPTVYLKSAKIWSKQVR